MTCVHLLTTKCGSANF